MLVLLLDNFCPELEPNDSLTRNLKLPKRKNLLTDTRRLAARSHSFTASVALCTVNFSSSLLAVLLAL